MTKTAFETIRDCIESYPVEKREAVKGLLVEYAEQMRSGTLDESQAREKAIKKLS